MRVFNFSAGPAILPEEVLAQAGEEMLDWHGSGMSVMEMSHRAEPYLGIQHQAEADLRALLGIPSDYRVLFLQGGAWTQFAMVPMNLLRGRPGADYVHTGIWSEKAIEEAGRFGRVRLAASSESSGFHAVPPQSGWQMDPGAAYLHYTTNETIGGVQFHWIPQTGTVPLVADMSSDILSQPVDVSRFGLIYAGAQKNIGPAGLTLVIVREDLIGTPMPGTPTMLDYRTHAQHDSMFNTPPTWAIYMAGLVFARLLRDGGLPAVAERNRAKAELLYGYIDGSGFYRNPVEPGSRSLMNVPFTLTDPALDATFLQGAERNGLLQLKGHRLAGGMRASIYNAMPLAGVEALVNYMKEFVRQHG
ncbi:MAG: 3-phosphoserine/phosphohydroxythreonine transaminase [Betaproteobacteria bacterium]|nr:3-phosphoserine/phosphohydroxythreonine transaminase [Betaproteobacteria bacterium]